MAGRASFLGVQRLFANLSVSAASKASSSSCMQQLGVRSYCNNAATPFRLMTTLQSSDIFNFSMNGLQCRNFSSKDSDTKKDEQSDKTGSSDKQHQEWVDFQRSIAVEGFETGQTTEVLHKSKRAGRRLSKRKSKEAIKLEERIAERQRLTDIGGGEYPPLRYSDAETERLLAQAYAAIPPRAGKRGTRNLKRQKRRWFLVRQIRKKYKKHLLRFQERKMAERSRRIKAVKAVLAEAPEIVDKDRAYQLEVFQRWSATMNSVQN